MATATLKSRIENLIAMTQLLERVDANPALVGAGQYRKLVQTVQALIDADDLPGDALLAVLRASPAAAQLYENLHYDRSGLSQSPLELAIDSELSARQFLGRLRERSADAQQGFAPPPSNMA
ncbi:hypothetical protein OOZ63_02535 [Paucibacter sp. PLA-PC-4]|uniref:hypothetical protein n=1 Tax=Paucibacter sp. PLA-PC-4 TaxID=2993655 RepID=UPI0022498DB7|nr:hypothetical protein [Paucibacter sp. PLA-PC-4]MCX2860710.1 hypothetical protein [Paucibacter sp. PLA-PC-4]